MKQSVNLQDSFLNTARRNNAKITIFLMNGYQIKGTVRGFDNYTIILNSEDKQQLIYKHAISTIIPNEEIILEF
nr:RNA chaperone Hfq [Tissierella sp.]